MKRILVLISMLTAAPAFGGADDCDWLAGQIEAHYAYLPERHLDLVKLRTLCRHDNEAGDTDILHVIERTIGELHDHHATLGANSKTSPQLIPSGTDLWAEVANGRARISQVRANSPAAEAGVRPGDEIVRIGERPVLSAIAEDGPHALNAPDPEAANFTLRQLLAGNHIDRRRFTVRRHDALLAFDLAPYQPPHTSALVSWRRIDDGIGYIRIENSLGDDGTVAAFDAALAALSDVRAIILDLRDTPSGGNTDVAEPIIGRFIDGDGAYQRVFEPGPGKTAAKDSWLKQAKARAPSVKAKLVVLVDHWTGSMGEGMAIGFDGLKRATVIGTEMAGLSGGTGAFTLPASSITVHFPVERLYHLDGTPREKWLPPVLVDPAGPGDPILERGVAKARSRLPQ